MKFTKVSVQSTMSKIRLRETTIENTYDKNDIVQWKPTMSNDTTLFITPEPPNGLE